MFDTIQVQTYAPEDGHHNALTEGQRVNCSRFASYAYRMMNNQNL